MIIVINIAQLFEKACISSAQLQECFFQGSCDNQL